MDHVRVVNPMGPMPRSFLELLFPSFEVHFVFFLGGVPFLFFLFCKQENNGVIYYILFVFAGP